MASLTKSQVNKLRDRLSKATTEADVGLLLDWRAEHLPVMCDVFREIEQLVMPVPVARSARIKNSNTIIEKIRRGSSLKSMQDVAGIRVVLRDGERAAQDDIANIIESSGTLSKVRRYDRRLEPMSGYRALHLVGERDGHNLEVQVRTPLQHDWAQMNERLADIVGRQIRYNGAPDPGASFTIKGAHLTALEVVDQASHLSERIDELERLGPSTPTHREDIRSELAMYRDVIAVKAAGATSPQRTPEEGMNIVVYDRVSATAVRWLVWQYQSFNNKGPDNDALLMVWRGLEEEYRGRDNIEIVLLAIESVESVHQTHERYFSSTPGTTGDGAAGDTGDRKPPIG